MKKTLFALLACATLAAPAMADWKVQNAFYSPYGDYTDKADYTFYLYHDSTASITSTAAMTNAIADMTLSEFTAAAGTGYAFTKVSTNGMIGTDGGISTPLTTLSANPANIWGVCVYNGENAAFSVKETNAEEALMMGEHYYSYGAAYTAFKSDSPVPEPATATLSLMALAGLCARRRRK